MRKSNNIKFQDQLPTPNESPRPLTLEEALAEALAEAAEGKVPASSIIKTYPDGYVNGLGEIFGADGLYAKKPSRASQDLASNTPAAPAGGSKGWVVVDTLEGQASASDE